MDLVMGEVNGYAGFVKSGLRLVGDAGNLYLLGDFIGKGGNEVLTYVRTDNRIKCLLGKHELLVLEAHYGFGNKALQRSLDEQEWYRVFREQAGCELERIVDWLADLPICRNLYGIYLGSGSAIDCDWERGPSFKDCLEGRDGYYYGQVKRVCYHSADTSKDVLSIGRLSIFNGSPVQIPSIEHFGFSRDELASIGNSSGGNECICMVRQKIKDTTVPKVVGESVFINSAVGWLQSSYCIGVKVSAEGMKAGLVYAA